MRRYLAVYFMIDALLHAAQPSCKGEGCKKPLLPRLQHFSISSIDIMPINTKRSGDDMELFLAARVDGAMANELEIAVLEAIRCGTKTLYINMAEATFLCSAGLRVLLQYWRQMKGAGKQLIVTNPSPEVNSVLVMTGFREQMVEGGQR